METWSQVDMLRNGSPVDEDTLNKPVRQLASRTDYLKRKLLQTSEDGSSVIIPDVPLSAEDTPEPGDVVYCGEDGTFGKASAKMSLYDDFEAADSAMTVGVLISLSSGDTGNVLVYGRLKFDAYTFDPGRLLEADETFRPGRYYLSAVTPGRITAHPTGPLVYVCSLQSEGGRDPVVAYVNPQFLDIGTSHVHRAYPLVARPAGHVVDGEVIGYLPDSSDSSLSSDGPGLLHLPRLKFHGQWTPTGKFVYSFEIGGSGTWSNTVFHWTCYDTDEHVQGTGETILHDQASAKDIDVGNGLRVEIVFPDATDARAFTDDVSGDDLVWSSMTFPDAGRGWTSCTDEDRGTGHPDRRYKYVMGLHEAVDRYFPPVPAKSAGLFVNGVAMESADLFPGNPTYEIGPDTLYWLTDERLPWPEGMFSPDDPVDPSVDKTIAFYFNVGFQCANGPVTSISPLPGSPIKTYAYGTRDPAYTGDISLDLDIDLEVVDGGLPGYQVAKGGQGGKLLAGPVVEKIKAGPGIVVVPARGCPEGQGTLTIGLDDGSLRGQFSEIALENAKQEKLGLFPYVSLLGWTQGSTNIPSAFTATMRVPTSLDPAAEYRLRFKAVVFGTAEYEGARRRAAGLRFEYNILPDYTDNTHRSLKTGLVVPDNPPARTVVLPLGHQDASGKWKYVAYDPFVASTDLEEDDPDVAVSVFGRPVPYEAEFTQPVGHLKPGYLVAVRIARTDNTNTVEFDSYSGQLGFLSLEWSLETA